MSEVKIYCSDLEATGLLHHLIEQGDKAKMHNFCAKSIETGSMWTFHTDTEQERSKIAKFLDREIVLIMHNGICYDRNALKFFGYDVSKVHFVDTLALSWYLDLNRPRHGLESYGDEFGVPKPEIKDWEDLTQEDYDERVQEDVKIQYLTYKKLKSRFEEIYGKMSDYQFCTHKVVKYLNFKMEQLSEQEQTKFKVDVPKAKSLVEQFTKEIEFKVEQLKSVMPQVPVYQKHKRPAKPFKQNGELSATGIKWKALTDEHKKPFDYDGEIKTIKSYAEPNPNSSAQIKSWLDSLGWIPETFKYVKDDDGSERKIPQIYVQGSGGQVCPSIEKLAEDNPALEHLVGLGVLSHRKGCVQAFIDNAIFGEYVEAGASGFTNTLRLKHRKPCVNLPSTRVIYGEDVRSCLIARDGKMLGGADLSSLENRIKFNLQLPYDREYVLSQMSDDFDPHLEIAQEGGLLKDYEVWFYKIEKEGFERSRYPDNEKLDEILVLPDSDKKALIKHISEVRGKGKGTNYSCLPMDTKILTKGGLKLFNEVEVGDVVYSYKNGELVEDVIKYKHFYKDANVVTFGDSKKDLRCTLNHRWLTQKRKWDNALRRNSKEYSEVTFEECSDLTTESKILTVAPYAGGVSSVTRDQARLLGWILSDGSFGQSTTIAQSKEKFYRDVEDTINNCGISYTKYTSPRDNGNDVFIYTLNKGEVRSIFDKMGLLLTKEQDFTEFLLKLSREALDSFVESFYLGDGGVKNSKSFTISQNVGNVLDAVQLALFLQGDGRVTVEGKGKCKVVRKHRTKYISCQRKTWKNPTVEDVFCLTTGNGSFVIVQDGEMMLTGNCQYGAGAATVARTAGVSLSVGKALVKAYKKVNWSIEKIAASQKVKKTSFGDYQLNPFNGVWYSLKTEKDRFSTLVQGTGAYVLDIWLKYQFNLRDSDQYGFSDEGVKLLATFHDEQIVEFKEGFEDSVSSLMKDALAKVNKTFKLEIPFDCDVQFGKKYSDIH